MKLTVRTAVLVGAVGVAAAGCGSTHSTNAGGAASSPAAARPASAIQNTQAAPAINALELTTGSDQQRIQATIQAFYKATWLNQGAAACSLFSPTGTSGFLKAAHIAFPQSVNATTSCPQAMAFFNATLADSANTLQQAGLNVSGNILEKVSVDHVAVKGSTATAVAPEGVEEFIKPKLFSMVRIGDRWMINSSSKIGQTLAQELAQAKAKGQLTPHTQPAKG